MLKYCSLEWSLWRKLVCKVLPCSSIRGRVWHIYKSSSSSVLCRVRHDHTGHGGRQNLPDFLRTNRLCSHHPVFQPVFGENYNCACVCVEVMPRSPTSEERCSASRQQTRGGPRKAGAQWGQSGGLEAVCVLRDAHPLRGSHHYILLRLCHVLLDGGLVLFGLSVLLLCSIQHYRIWGHGERPACCVRQPDSLQPGQLYLHPHGGLLHLLTLQCHINRHQAGSQLAPEEAWDTVPTLPGKEPASRTERYNARPLPNQSPEHLHRHGRC